MGWHTRRNCHTIANIAEKYHVVVQQHPNWWRWEWEVFRNGSSMAARLRGGNHSTKNSAEKAGARALREFLAALERERWAE